MIDVSQLLYEICENEQVFDSEFDLIESGVLDSFMFIELFSKLEDYGIELQPARIEHEQLRTPKSIKELINSQ